MEAFLRAMTHELRAPLQVITGFAEELRVMAPRAMRRSIVCAASELLPSEAQDYTSLLNFGRLGHGAVRQRRMSLHGVIASCLRQLQAEIQARDARVTVLGNEVVLSADPTLLKYALTNLLANALIFVARCVARGYRGGGHGQAYAALK